VLNAELKGDNDFALGKKQKPLYARFQLSPAITPEIQNNHSYLQRSPHVSLPGSLYEKGSKGVRSTFEKGSDLRLTLVKFFLRVFNGILIFYSFSAIVT